jgi:RNA polymerase sigma-70 factor, ECF subfamily
VSALTTPLEWRGLGRPWSARSDVDSIGPVRVSGGDSLDRNATTDRELVALMAAGDTAALAEVYQRHVGLVFGLARRVLADDAAAEDATQEVFVYLWRHPERFDPSRGTLRSWLGVLAHRRSVDQVRSEVRRGRNEARQEPAGLTAAPQTAVDDDLADAWLSTRVKEALDMLPVEQREAVVLAYFGGRTYRQVAAELAIPEGTAKSRLRLALGKLDELLRPSLRGQDAPAWI